MRKYFRFTVKNLMVLRSLYGHSHFEQSTFKDFQTVCEGEIWCSCTVTFGQKSSKLNNRPDFTVNDNIMKESTNVVPFSHLLINRKISNKQAGWVTFLIC